MKKSENLCAVNTRIERHVADEMNSLLAVTKKSTSAFVQDAVLEYLAQVCEKEYKPSKALQIDKFAMDLHKEEGKTK